MSNPASSLPDSWVERIWSAMRATYGAAFDRQWECPAGADPVEHVTTLKAHWARELRGFQQSPQSIGYALENLPPHPPNLVEFRAICNRRPEQAAPALPAPKASPNVVKAVVEGLKAGAKGVAPMDWAYALQEREQAGHPLTMAQQIAWREALAEAPIAQIGGEFVPPPPESLPPGMRGEA